MYKLKLPNTAKITTEEHFIIKLLDQEIIEGKYTKSTKEIRVYASDPKAAVTVLNYFFQRQNENFKNIDISKNESILDTIIVNDKEITLNYEYYLVKEEQEKEFELNTETDKMNALNDLISRDKSDKLENLLIQSRRKVGCMEEWDSELKDELKNYFEKESKCTKVISSLLDRIGSASHFRDSFEIENLEKKHIKGIPAFLILLEEEKKAHKEISLKLKKDIDGGIISKIKRKVVESKKKLRMFDLEEVTFTDKYGRIFNMEIQTLQENIKGF